MADEIGVMYEGRIQQWDVPYNLYHRPANRFVADFIGQGVLLPGTVAGGTHVEMELGKLVSDIPIDVQRNLHRLRRRLRGRRAAPPGRCGA